MTTSRRKARRQERLTAKQIAQAQKAVDKQVRLSRENPQRWLQLHAPDRPGNPGWSGLTNATPEELAGMFGVSALQVRRVLRLLFGTLERQGRGYRWYLTESEVAQVMAEARRRRWPGAQNNV